MITIQKLDYFTTHAVTNSRFLKIILEKINSVDSADYSAVSSSSGASGSSPGQQ
jgi:hypothetical protein